MEKIDIQKQFKVQTNEDLKRYEFNSIDNNSVSYTVGFHEASTIEDAYIAVYLAIQKDTKPQPSEQSPSEASEQKGEDIKCPFCDLSGFDKIGLKYHLRDTPCQQYLETPLLTKF